jgi:hypothetical protein
MIGCQMNWKGFGGDRKAETLYYSLPGSNQENYNETLINFGILRGHSKIAPSE